MLRKVRIALYAFLFACTTVLLGLTAYRVHYTKSLDHPDVLTTRTHFYDPRIVALMVASIVGLIFSIAMIATLAVGFNKIFAEIGSIIVLWIFFLITSALVTEQFSNLKWCRSHHKVCSVLETIKAFGWICWGFLFIIFFVAAAKMFLSGTGSRANRGTPAYPDTRQTQNAPATVHTQQPVQNVQAHGTAPGVQTKQNSSVPTTTTNDPIV